MNAKLRERMEILLQLGMPVTAVMERLKVTERDVLSSPFSDCWTRQPHILAMVWDEAKLARSHDLRGLA